MPTNEEALAESDGHSSEGIDEKKLEDPWKPGPTPNNDK